MTTDSRSLDPASPWTSIARAFFCLLLAALVLSQRPALAQSAAIPTFGYEVVHSYPHDPDAVQMAMDIVG